MSSVDIVIVNWNAGRLLQACVDSLASVAEEVDLGRVVIVDNASTDDSLGFLERYPSGRPYPNYDTLPIELIENTINLGFASGCNAGAEGSNADYLLFLNPDTELRSGALSAPAAFLEDKKNADVGIVGIQLVDAKGVVVRTCAHLPTPSRAIARMAALDRLFPSLGHFETEWDHGETRAVDQVMGAFFFTRRSLFEELGGFDERFFVYLEEVDYTLRAKQRGWATWYLSEAQAYHHGAGTTSQVKDRRLFYALRSRILYYFKHFNRSQAGAYVAAVFSLELIARLMDAARRRSFSTARDTLSAYRMLIHDVPAMYRTVLAAPTESKTSSHFASKRSSL